MDGKRGMTEIGAKGKSENQCMTVIWLQGKLTSKLLQNVFLSFFGST